MLSEVEMHAADGRRMEWASIAFIDMQEYDEFSRKGGGPRVGGPRSSDAERYVVSATLRAPSPGASTERRLVHFPPRRSADDN